MKFKVKYYYEFSIEFDITFSEIEYTYNLLHPLEHINFNFKKLFNNIFLGETELENISDDLEFYLRVIYNTLDTIDYNNFGIEYTRIIYSLIDYLESKEEFEICYNLKYILDNVQL